MKEYTCLENKHFKDLNPLDYGHKQCEPNYSYTYIRSSYTLIHYVLSGKGTVKSQGVTYEVHPGEAFIRHVGVPITYTADALDPWEYSWIVFNGDLAKRFESLPVVFPCNKEPFERMKKVLTMDSMCEEHLASCLFMLSIYLFKDTDADNTISQVKNYMDLNYENPISGATLAALVNVNRSYLARRFKKETGVCMKNYITTLKMNKALELLETGMTVNETATALAYTDQFVFSKAFKRFYGYSPSKAIKKRS